MPRNALVLQCGGPTAVFNASLAGVMRAWRAERSGGTLLGARHGLRGLAEGRYVDLGGCDDRALEHQPGALLGAGRDPLTEETMETTLGHVERHDVEVLFLIGGNGSMKAASAIASRAPALRVIGIPKTIDNDIAGTDVTPGYGSAARFIAQSVRDVGLDLGAMRGFDDVAIIETMGRSAGWLAAAAVLARYGESAPPHLVLLPELPLREDRFLETVRRQHARERISIVVCAEGVRGLDGVFLAEKMHALDLDPAGQKLLGIMGGPAPYLARLVRDRLGLRCRQMRPDVMQRSASALVSEIDRGLALQVGSDAVGAALDGCSAVMIALERREQGWASVPVPLASVAGRERLLPAEFVAADGFGPTAAFSSYARPLIGAWSPSVAAL
jgi:6-phosphofructokinase 1